MIFNLICKIKLALELGRQLEGKCFAPMEFSNIFYAKYSIRFRIFFNMFNDEPENELQVFS